jgi:uncharacterized lipoprotein NlpE involved in copper resistance
MMKSLFFGASLVILSLGVVGCQEDNEAAIREQQAKAGKADVKNSPPQAKTQAEYGKQVETAKGSLKGMGYPGAKQ